MADDQRMNQFVRVATRIGRRYLSCGGPTSRLEDRLTEAGQVYGYKTEVFATPTGVFVSCVSANGEQIVTLLDRIKEMSTDLTELDEMEKLLNRLKTGNEDLSSLLSELDSPIHQFPYPLWLLVVGAFGVGAFSSHMRYGSSTALFLSGLLTVLVFIMSKPLVQKLRVSSIFGDFFGCLLALAGAGAFAQIFDYPAEAFAIGSLVLIVPGLTLTTAISELADQNFASGTIKLMKGALTLLAMATAYILFLESAQMVFESEDLWYGKGFVLHSQPNWVALVNNMGLIISFGIIFKVPRPALLWATITGLVGWIVFRSTHSPNAIVISSFLASTAVGTTSLIFSRIFKVPSQIYSVPGILSLLPGMLALSTMTGFGVAGERPGSEIAFSVALIGCAIVFGLLASRLPFTIVSRRHWDS